MAALQILQVSSLSIIPNYMNLQKFKKTVDVLQSSYIFVWRIYKQLPTFSLTNNLHYVYENAM